MNSLCEVLLGDCRETLKDVPDKSVQVCVTSPPYFGLRDYGDENQIGLESTLDEYVQHLQEVVQEVGRVLKPDGTLWLNLGDSYAGSGRGRLLDGTHAAATPLQRRNTGSIAGVLLPRKSDGKKKDLMGVPWKVALALRDEGWYLRSDIIWSKTNIMPESVKDRPTRSHEYIFLLSKNREYYYDYEAVLEPQAHTDIPDARNRRSVWTVNSVPYKEAHFATFPEEIPRICILAGSKPGDVVLDPFAGSGTTGKVALELGRKAILCEVNPTYGELIKKRTTTTLGMAI